MLTIFVASNRKFCFIKHLCYVTSVTDAGIKLLLLLHWFCKKTVADDLAFFNG